jgi:hypothetical protein
VVLQVPKVEETDTDSNAHQFYRESEVMAGKQEYKLHPPIYNIWKYEVQVSYPVRCYGPGVLKCTLYNVKIALLGCEVMCIGKNLLL